MRTSSTMATWLFFAGGAAVLVGVASAAVQFAGVAPVGIGSLWTGAGLGLVLAVIVRLARWQSPRLIWTIVICCALATVMAQHAWFYRHYRLEWHRVRNESPEVALFRDEQRPLPPLKYLAGEATAMQIVYWLVDAVLVTTAAAGTVAVLNRREAPY